MGSLLLIRHGQASFGAADYDQLSAVGAEQSQRLGAWLRHVGQSPDLIALGSLRRHIQTAEMCMEAAGMTAPSIELAGLDELDHEEIIARLRPDLATHDAFRAELERADDPRRALQQLYAAAVERWIGGRFDDQYTRAWPSFRQGVLDSLEKLAAHDARTIWAFTSGGPIAVIVNALMHAPREEAFAVGWPLVNTSMTRVVIGAKQNRLLSYNASPHLDGAGDRHLITHR
jgi:broad specificity phosphatase PhoE